MKTRNHILWVVCFAVACGGGEVHQVRPAAAPQSLESYEEARQRDPSDAENLLQLGWAYLERDRNRAAVEVLQKRVEGLPDDADGHYYLGVALAREQLKTEAVAAFEKAVALQPGFAEAHWALALLYNERGDGYEQAIEACRRGLELVPESAYGHFVHGFVQCSRGGGDNETAAQALRRAVELDPDLAHAHYYLALVYLRLQDDPRAIEAVEETIRADPDYTEAYYTLGTLYARTGRVGDGERMIGLFERMSASIMREDHYNRLLYRQSEPLNPVERAASHFNLGLVHLRQKRFSEALTQFEASLEINPGNAEAWLNIGTVHSLRGEFDEAANRYRQALEIDPGYALAQVNLGSALMAKGKYPAAEAAFRRAIELDSTSVEARHGLGTALIQQGKVEEGRKWRRQAADGEE